MSRAYNAKRKARRQKARDAAQSERRSVPSLPRRWSTFAPVLLIAVVLTLVGILGFGAENGVSKRQIAQEVTALLDGIPQDGSTLGSSKAPITLRMYADLECPTVKLFVEDYLPAILENWVRPGLVKLDYRSLKTDTSDEQVFFKQELAALAAGRQDRMWNFVLTFVREQGEPRSSYVSEEFLGEIASQVPELDRGDWHRARDDVLLSKRVALGVYSGHTNGLRSTPSFLIAPPENSLKQQLGRASLKRDLEASMVNVLTSLQKESREDFPTLKAVGSGLLGG